MFQKPEKAPLYSKYLRHTILLSFFCYFCCFCHPFKETLENSYEKKMSLFEKTWSKRKSKENTDDTQFYCQKTSITQIWACESLKLVKPEI